ncbi:transglycosylase family protein [Longivirga aurantiaca]|uniref:Transglycosylase family protein n=1 Tax=Longivirga aurantiaca TaxID=1837743 RepID=A0ABW1SYZ6_9ACTN
MTTVMPTHARTGMERTRARVTFGVLSAALGLSLLTPAPAGAAPLAPTHLVGGGASAFVDDTAFPDTLPATGTTSAAPARVVSTEVLRGGHNGAKVRWVQRILGLPQTGFFGPATRDAVIRFQEALGATKGTGIVGPITRRQLQEFGEQQAAKAVRKAAAAKRAAAAAEAARKAAARKAAEQAATRGTTRSAPAPSASNGDPTMTAAARGSRAARQAVPFAVWRSSAHARMIVARESGGSCTAVSPTGAYRGAWQMGAPFWRSFGGLTFAPTPDQATCGEQDYVAYRGWIAAWWSPWGG